MVVLSEKFHVITLIDIIYINPSACNIIQVLLEILLGLSCAVNRIAALRSILRLPLLYFVVLVNWTF